MAGRFTPHGDRPKRTSSTAGKKPYTRFRRRGSNKAGIRQAASENGRAPVRRFRPHSVRSRSTSERGRETYTVRDVSAVGRTERYISYWPVPYPVYPVYPAAAPPYSSYTHAGGYVVRLSRREIAELEAKEAYEDRYGRDFDRYSRHTRREPPQSGEIFPRNYLIDQEDS